MKLSKNESKLERKPLTAVEASYIVDCSPDDLHAAAKRGLIKANHVGRRVFFSIKDVKQYKAFLDGAKKAEEAERKKAAPNGAAR